MTCRSTPRSGAPDNGDSVLNSCCSATLPRSTSAASCPSPNGRTASPRRFAPATSSGDLLRSRRPLWASTSTRCRRSVDRLAATICRLCGPGPAVAAADSDHPAQPGRRLAQPGVRRRDGGWRGHRRASSPGSKAKSSRHVCRAGSRPAHGDPTRRRSLARRWRRGNGICSACTSVRPTFSGSTCRSRTTRSTSPAAMSWCPCRWNSRARGCRRWMPPMSNGCSTVNRAPATCATAANGPGQLLRGPLAKLPACIRKKERLDRRPRRNDDGPAASRGQHAGALRRVSGGRQGDHGSHRDHSRQPRAADRAADGRGRAADRR